MNRAAVPNIFLLVVVSDELIFSIVLQLVCRHLSQNLHVLSEVQLHATLFQIILSVNVHQHGDQ